MTSLTVTHFASSTARLGLSNPAEITRSFPSVPGTVVAVRALTENPQYPDVECVDGSFARIRPGDVVAGVLGSRQALRGYVGYAPVKAAPGDRLHLLNLGGVIGRMIDGHPDLGPAVEVELLGGVLQNRKIAHLRRNALPAVDFLPTAKPIILVMGSCMNVGKTAAATEIVRLFARRGARVGAAKISGVACLKDPRRMKLAGAVEAYSFLDCGFPSTVDAEDVSVIARSLVAALCDASDVIVLELGDGIMGHYGVESVLDDRSFMTHVDAVVFCAGDLVSAWGAREYLARKNIPIHVVCGPATDTCAGTTYIEGQLGLRSANALTDPDALYTILSSRIALPSA